MRFGYVAAATQGYSCVGIDGSNLFPVRPVLTWSTRTAPQAYRNCGIKGPDGSFTPDAQRKKPQAGASSAERHCESGRRCVPLLSSVGTTPRRWWKRLWSPALYLTMVLLTVCDDAPRLAAASPSSARGLPPQRNDDVLHQKGVPCPP